MYGYGYGRFYGLRGGACGDMPAIGEPMMPDPRARDAAGGLKIVPTVWVQRAINAAIAAGRPWGSALTVDGDAGARTLNAVKAARLWLLSQLHPIPDDPRYTAMPSIVDAGHVAMPWQLHATLAGATRVPDPSGSTVAECSWSAPARAPSSSSAPSSPSSSSSGSAAIVDASSGSGNAGLPASAYLDPRVIAATSDSWMPSVIAFVAAAAVGFGGSYMVLKRQKGMR